MICTDAGNITKMIPKKTSMLRLLGRHSMAVQSGKQQERPLTPDGWKLCLDVQPFYLQLFYELKSLLNQQTAGLDWNVQYDCSGNRRSEQSLRLIMGVSDVTSLPILNFDGSLGTLPGDWWKSRFEAQMPFTDIFADFINDKSLWSDDYTRDQENYKSWIQGTGAGLFGVTFAHEVAASLAVIDHLTDGTQPGLEECQSYLVCLDNNFNILGVIKCIPPGTKNVKV